MEKSYLPWGKMAGVSRWRLEEKRSTQEARKSVQAQVRAVTG